MLTLNTLDDAKKHIPEIVAEFMDSLAYEGEVLGDVYIKTVNIKASKTVMTSLKGWVTAGKVYIPREFYLESIASFGDTATFDLVSGESVLRIIATSSSADDDNKVKLPLEVFNDSPIDAERAMKATRDLCKMKEKTQ